MKSDTSREYSTKDIAHIVDIATPTIRKYAQLLEKSGYTFMRNDQGHRIFTDRHILLFREMKHLSKQGTVPVERIADMITTKERQSEKAKNKEAIQGVSEVATPLEEKEESKSIGQYDERYEVLLKKLEKLDMIDDIQKKLDEQVEFNKLLMNQLEKQQRYIEERLEDRDERLIESFRQLQEQRQAMLEIASSKKKWWQVWKKQ